MPQGLGREETPLEAGQRAVDLLAMTGTLLAGTVVQLEVIDEQEAERRMNMPSLPELAAGKEAAELLSISKQRLHQLLERDNFPGPVVRLASGPVWLVESLRAFERNWPRRPGRPALAKAPA